MMLAPLGHRVTPSIDLSFLPAPRRPTARSPAPSLEGLGLSHPTPPRISPPSKTWLGIPERERWGVEGICFPLWVSHAGCRLSADQLPLGNIQSSSLDSSIVARKRRAVSEQAGETQIHKSCQPLRFPLQLMSCSHPVEICDRF